MPTRMIRVETTIPEDVYLTLKDHGLAREELGTRARQLLAIRFFQEHLLSLGKAARLAGLDRWRFIDLLGEHKVPVVDLDEEEFAGELESVDAISQSLAKPDAP
jgi:predicted HTH domain antitoxin